MICYFLVIDDDRLKLEMMNLDLIWMMNVFVYEFVYSIFYWHCHLLGCYLYVKDVENVGCSLLIWLLDLTWKGGRSAQELRECVYSTR